MFDFSIVIPHLGSLARGLLVTIQLAALAIVVGVVLGFFLSLARRSVSVVLRWSATCFVEFFRGTPALVQIIWAYFALPTVLGADISSFQACAIALSLNASAYFCEVIRSSIAGVPDTQRDAGRTLGLSTVDSYRFVILPQALRIALPPATSIAVALIKFTSLGSAIGLLELTRTGQLIGNESFRPVEALTVVALVYFGLAYPLTVLSRALEKSMKVSVTQ